MSASCWRPHGLDQQSQLQLVLCEIFLVLLVDFAAFVGVGSATMARQGASCLIASTLSQHRSVEISARITRATAHKLKPKSCARKERRAKRSVSRMQNQYTRHLYLHQLVSYYMFSFLKNLTSCLHQINYIGAFENISGSFLVPFHAKNSAVGM